MSLADAMDIIALIFLAGMWLCLAVVVAIPILCALEWFE